MGLTIIVVAAEEEAETDRTAREYPDSILCQHALALPLQMLGDERS